MTSTLKLMIFLGFILGCVAAAIFAAAFAGYYSRWWVIVLTTVVGAGVFRIGWLLRRAFQRIDAHEQFHQEIEEMIQRGPIRVIHCAGRRPVDGPTIN